MVDCVDADCGEFDCCGSVGGSVSGGSVRGDSGFGRVGGDWSLISLSSSLQGVSADTLAPTLL